MGGARGADKNQILKCCVQVVQAELENITHVRARARNGLCKKYFYFIKNYLDHLDPASNDRHLRLDLHLDATWTCLDQAINIK